MEKFKHVTDAFEKHQRGVAHAGNPQGGVTKQEEQGGMSADEQVHAQEESTDPKVTGETGPNPVPEPKKTEENPASVPDKGVEPSPSPSPSVPEQAKEPPIPATPDKVAGQSKTPPPKVLPAPAVTAVPLPKQGENTDAPKRDEVDSAPRILAEDARESVSPAAGGSEGNKSDQKVADASVVEAGPKTNSEVIPYRTPEEKARAVKEIRKLHFEILCHGQNIRNLRRTTLPKCLRIGELLIPLKESVAYGEWQLHVGQTVGIDPRTASNYMRVYRERDRLPKSETISDLEFVDALKLLGKPKMKEPKKELEITRKMIQTANEERDK